MNRREEALFRKGRMVNLVGLREQALASWELAVIEDHVEPLRRAGWTPESSEALRRGYEAISDQKLNRLESQTDARRKTLIEVAMRSEARRLIRLLRNAAPSVLNKLEPDEESLLASMMAGNAGSSSASLVNYLEKVQPVVQALDEALKPFNDGRSLASEMSDAKNALAMSDAEQEVARQALPAETRRLHLLKGEVLERIEELNRLARNAFDGQATTIGRFNKDLLLRATRTRQRPEEDPAAEEAAD